MNCAKMARQRKTEKRRGEGTSGTDVLYDITWHDLCEWVPESSCTEWWTGQNRTTGSLLLKPPSDTTQVCTCERERYFFSFFPSFEFWFLSYSHCVPDHTIWQTVFTHPLTEMLHWPWRIYKVWHGLIL